MLANLPGVGYESAPRRFRETRSTILEWQDSFIELLRCAVQYSTATPSRADKRESSLTCAARHLREKC
jgi:hypothetical protein